MGILIANDEEAIFLLPAIPAKSDWEIEVSKKPFLRIDIKKGI